MSSYIMNDYLLIYFLSLWYVIVKIGLILNMLCPIC